MQVQGDYIKLDTKFQFLFLLNDKFLHYLV